MEEGGGRIADHDEGAFDLRPPELDRGGAPGRAERLGQGRDGGVGEGAAAGGAGRQAALDDAGCDHAGVAENGPAGFEGRARPLGHGPRQARSERMSVMPEAWTRRRASGRRSAGSLPSAVPASASMIANDRS